MALFKDKKMTKNSVVNRTFSYLKEGIKLDFTLRTDVKKDLKTFLEILEVAINDVKTEINKK